MRATLRPFLGTAALAAALALPAAAGAQQPLDPVKVSARSAQADKLDARAAELQATNSRWQWRRSAELRERAAELRPATDVRAFESLQTAALVRHALAERGAAIVLMERAAERAMARGDVFNAATAYANLAFMTSEVRDVDRAREFVEKSTLLASSPLLSAPQREWLQTRLAERPTAAKAGTALAVAPAIP
ncbi:hypothetical protein [Roseisolibacter sp. H3M3-2]|uniref:hypothetical protein n=1 Tax=Roseisolibacter sp. H3M3-2 TaxID=3031323 RepID=UPI0023DA08F9|nr:hypothetical protein [Roseisolibacter sp. H3M3-2]MDF1504238.1 hypothetical protein [Roseisolibacter sp. H3M3-2]